MMKLTNTRKWNSKISKQHASMLPKHKWPKTKHSIRQCGWRSFKNQCFFFFSFLQLTQRDVLIDEIGFLFSFAFKSTWLHTLDRTILFIYLFMLALLCHFDLLLFNSARVRFAWLISTHTHTLLSSYETHRTIDYNHNWSLSLVQLSISFCTRKKEADRQTTWICEWQHWCADRILNVEHMPYFQQIQKCALFSAQLILFVFVDLRR